MDWQQFLGDYHIDYVTRGPNTKRGEVSVKCPWCGENDKSHHMGISLTRDSYACWRDAGHRGKKPHRLVKALLGCSSHQAGLVLAQYGAADPDALVPLTFDTPAPTKEVKTLELPAGARLIKKTGFTSRHWNYLAKNRGFGPDTGRVVEKYGLFCTVSGKHADRVILPIFHGKKLVNWTGRALIRPNEAARYKTLSNEESLVDIKHTVYNEKELERGGELLIVVEGPFDMMKMDFYNPLPKKVRVTCIFGTAVTKEQLYILADLSKVFKHVLILLDPDGAESASLTIATELEPYRNIKTTTLQADKDPGDHNAEEVGALIRKLFQQAVSF